MRVLCIYK